VDLTLTHLRQLADVMAGLRDVVSRHGLCRITSELVETVEYRAQLREDVEGAMGSLRKFEALLCSEQAPRRTRQLLSAEERNTDKPFSVLLDLDADQSERRASFLCRVSRFQRPMRSTANGSLTASRPSNSGSSRPIMLSPYRGAIPI
jgi:hypothetical protein